MATGWLVCPVVPHRAHHHPSPPTQVTCQTAAGPLLLRTLPKLGQGPQQLQTHVGRQFRLSSLAPSQASLSADICSGLASDGGGAHGPGDSQLRPSPSMC